MISSDSTWPIPHEIMVKNDIKIISTPPLFKKVELNHILYANLYPDFFSVTKNDGIEQWKSQGQLWR